MRANDMTVETGITYDLCKDVRSALRLALVGF